MRDGEEDFVVGMSFGAVITIVLLMFAWAVGGLESEPTATDNCPVEYKAK